MNLAKFGCYSPLAALVADVGVRLPRTTPAACRTMVLRSSDTTPRLKRELLLTVMIIQIQLSIRLSSVVVDTLCTWTVFVDHVSMIRGRYCFISEGIALIFCFNISHGTVFTASTAYSQRVVLTSTRK